MLIPAFIFHSTDRIEKERSEVNQDLVQGISPIPLVQDIDGKEVIQAIIDIKQEIRNNPKISIKGKSSRQNKLENGVCLPPLLPPQAADQLSAERIDQKSLKNRSKNRK